MIKKLFKFFTKPKQAKIVKEEPELTELEKTLKISHDWVNRRVSDLLEKNEYQDADSILCEFHEWMDPDIEDHYVVSMHFKEKNL